METFEWDMADNINAQEEIYADENIDYSDIDIGGLSPLEMYIKGNSLNNEFGGNYDPETAIKYYQAAADHGCEDAMFDLAKICYSNEKPSYEKAMSLYKKAAAKGHTEAKFYAAKMYLKGNGTEKDYEQAVKWFDEAGKDGYEDAWIYSGTIYYHGENFEANCNVKEDRAKAFEWFKKGIEIKPNDINVDDFISNYYLGLMYLNGSYVNQDYETAFLYFEKAAERGLWAALECIFIMYEKGWIKNNNFKNVNEWFLDEKTYYNLPLELAARGLEIAARRLAEFFLKGDLLDIDFNHGISFLSDWEEYLLSSLPECSWLKTRKGSQDKENTQACFERGIFWLEMAVEKRDIYAFIALCRYFYDNRKLPTAENFYRMANIMFPVKDEDIDIIYNREDCIALCKRILEIIDYIRVNNVFSLRRYMKNEQNSIFKAGVLMKALYSIDIEIILKLLAVYLKYNDTDNKTGNDYNTIGKRLIYKGVEIISDIWEFDKVKPLLADIMEEDLDVLEEEWKDIKDNSDTLAAVMHHFRGEESMRNKNWDLAIADFKTAISRTELEDYKKEFTESLREACSEKQSEQNFEERFASHFNLVNDLKNLNEELIPEPVMNMPKEVLAEFVCVLALYEEYEILDNLIKQAMDKSFINANVRIEFAFWEPTALYFITTHRAWNKMKDPKKMLKFLINNGADINAAAGDGSTPLGNQTYHDSSLEILQMLLEMGADPDKTCLFDEKEWTPLTSCLSTETIEDDVEHPFDDTAIKRAELLLNHGANPNLSRPNFEDYPPLVRAIKFGFITEGGPNKGESASRIMELLKLLIEKGADVNFRDSNNQTPLSIAKKNNLTAVEELLLKHGALPLSENS